MTNQLPVPPTKPCPICGRPAEPDLEPFCSKRCADVDLNRWLGGVYALPSSSERVDDDMDDQP